MLNSSLIPVDKCPNKKQFTGNNNSRIWVDGINYVAKYKSELNSVSNDKVALKITVPKSTLLSLPSDSYQVNLTIWVESDYDVVPLVLKVELMRESLVDKQGEDNSSDLSNKIFNGISIVLLIGILGVLLLIFWREYSKNDEEDLDKNLSPGVNYLETETTTSTLQNNISSELSYEDLTQHLPQPDLSGAPPVPETGLPDGWTFEQWQHYGQQWLNQQK